MLQDLIVGCDPGFGGAIAFFSVRNRTLVDVLDIPTVDPFGPQHWRKTGKADRIEFDIPKLAKIFQSQAPIIESVHSSPQMGVTSSFRFGHGLGLLEATMASLYIRTQKVAPSVWKSALGLSRNKSESLDLARRKWPHMKAYFKLKQDHGRAEAALLAEYGLRFLGEKVETDPMQEFL